MKCLHQQPFWGSMVVVNYMRKGVGAQGRNRTTDTAIFSRMLYQLSYLGIEGQAWGYRAPVSACPEGHFCGAAHRNWRHSTLIPASLMMTPHLSISAFR